MKKPKKIKYREVKNFTSQLEQLGNEGWKLAAVDKGDGIFVLEESPAYEYNTVQLRLRPRQETDLQSVVDDMAKDGWRLLSTLQGPRTFDLTLIFERET